MESIGLGSDQDASRRLTVLRAIDKFDRLGVEGVKQLLGEGRKDESGDFTVGAGLTTQQIERILICLRPVYGHEQRRSDVNRPYDDMEWIPVPGIEGLRFIDNFGTLIYLSQIGLGPTGTQGIQELNDIAALCDQSGYGSMRIKIDPSIVRGLEYYTGPVYEVELLIHQLDDKGRALRFGSVGGGGRYDGLVSRFRGEPVPATGFSIGVSRLQAALTTLGKLDTSPEAGPVVVTVFDRDRVADYQEMVARLRKANIRAELYLGNPKNMSNQLKYADRRNSPCVIIQGSDEQNDPDGPKVTIKDLWVGSTVTSVEKDRDRYLQTHRLIQDRVPVSELVEAVLKILNWHGIGPRSAGAP
jgi:histidyl-tRNA synthetase